MINKGHLKYKTTTLTLGNISSVEQLVPPLSLWKGVPGAASACPAPSDSLPASALPALVVEALGGLGREAEGGLPEATVGRARCRLSRVPWEDRVLWGRGGGPGGGLEETGRPGASTLWGCPADSPFY